MKIILAFNFLSFLFNVPRKNNYINFEAGGMTVFYELGVTKYLKENYNVDNIDCVGASAGSWCAMLLQSQLNTKEFDNVVTDVIDIIDSVDKPWSEAKDKIIEYTNKNPIRIKNPSKVWIKIAKYENIFPKGYYLNDLYTSREFIEACFISSWVPFFSGGMYTLKDGIPSWDGVLVLGDINPPEFLNKKHFEVSRDMWEREWKWNDIIVFSKENALKMYENGYLDTIKYSNLIHL